MGSETISGVPGDFPFEFTRPTVEIKSEWSGEWEESFDLEVDMWNYKVGKAGISEAHLHSRYGDKIKLPTDDDFDSKDPLDYGNYWIRISIPDDDDDPQIVFQGRIYNDGREPLGNAERMMGRQSWVAFGPKAYMHRIKVYSGNFLQDADEVVTDWLPPMNSRDKRKTLVGNRSEDSNEDSIYLYGGKALWDHSQYAEMILDKKVNREDEPQFTLTGATSVLELLQTSIDWGVSTDAAQIFDKLISRDYGMDYKFNYTDDGFDIFVFTLNTEDITFGEVTIPANPDTVNIERASQLDLIEISTNTIRDNRVDSVRVLGARVLICHSLSAVGVGEFSGDDSLNTGDLVRRWSDDDLAAYLAGTGDPTDDADQHDKAREVNKFKPVFQAFGVPLPWDMRGGDLAPFIGLDGNIDDDLSPADFQSSIRGTLSGLPLKRNWDYTDEDGPIDNNDVDVDPEFLPPMAFIFSSDDDSDPSNPRYVECDREGIHVRTPHNDWGIIVETSPNHRLALNHNFGPGSTEEDTTMHDPVFDYESLIATIARESDQRLIFGVDLPDDAKIGDGSIYAHEIEDAELWLLAPNTVVGVDADGTLLKSPDQWTVLRNDTDRLAFTAAGLVSRFLNDRVRGRMVLKGHRGWADLLGELLLVVDEAGSFTSVGSPITSMEWAMNSNGIEASPDMKVLAGYASE